MAHPIVRITIHLPADAPNKDWERIANAVMHAPELEGLRVEMASETAVNREIRNADKARRYDQLMSALEPIKWESDPDA